MGLLVISGNKEGFFANLSKQRLNATRPLFGVECGRASTRQQLLTILIAVSMPIFFGPLTS